VVWQLIPSFWSIITQRVPLVEQELSILPEHPSSPPVFSGVRVTRSLVLCVYFVDRCLSFCTFFFGHCVVCFSSIYRFWLPLWYLQTLLKLLNCLKYISFFPEVVWQLIPSFWSIIITNVKFSFICSKSTKAPAYVVNISTMHFN
jgi:hypothetical protein